MNKMSTPTRIKSKLLTVAGPQTATDVPQTPYLNLNLPPTGFPSWGPELNQNFSSLDAAVGALQRSYQGDWINNRVYAAGQIVIFNGGVYISLISGNINLQPDQHPESWGPMGSATSITYPPAGVAVSAGSSGWSPSLPLATVARTNISNVFTMPQSANTFYALSTYANPIITGGVFDFAPGSPAYARIIGSSTGTDTPGVRLMGVTGSGDAITYMKCDTTGTEIDGVVGLRGLTSSVVALPNGMQIAWNISGGNGETDFVNSRGGGGGGYAWYNIAPGATVTNATATAMYMNNANDLHINGGCYSQRNAVYGPSYPAETTVSNVTLNVQLGHIPQMMMTEATAAANNRLWDCIVVGTTMQFRTLDDTSNGSVWLNVTRSGTTPLEATFAAGLKVTSKTGNSGNPGANGAYVQIGLASDSGSPMVFLSRGDGAPGLNIIRWSNAVRFDLINLSGTTVGSPLLLFDDGSATVQQTLFANALSVNGSKQFVIVYPGDNPTEDGARILTHACIEGPENAVFYRGEAVTDADGKLTITLPEYFEGLVREDDRTVQVTQMEDDGDSVGFAMLIASRIADGRFRVRSSQPGVLFAWEVKGVRADIPPVNVVRPIASDDGKRIIDVINRNRAKES
jgi:hypothetical protein